MLGQRKKGRFGRLPLRLKGRDAASTAITVTQTNQTSQIVYMDYNDGQRARDRYKEAAKQLKDAIKIHSGLGSFDFEELSGEPEGFDDSQFKNKINTALISREMSIKDRKGWPKFTHVVECVFTALSPFAKNLLMIAKDSQWVMSLVPFILIVVQMPVSNPYGLICGGLLLLITVAPFKNLTSLTTDCG
jgi:hypothetical protein